MYTDIYAHQYSLPKAVKQYAKQRIYTAFSSYEPHILRVVMRVSNSHHAQNSEAKQCLVFVMLVDGPDVVIECMEADLYKAIDQGVKRASMMTARKVKQVQAQQRIQQLFYVGEKSAYLH